MDRLHVVNARGLIVSDAIEGEFTCYLKWRLLTYLRNSNLIDIIVYVRSNLLTQSSNLVVSNFFFSWIEYG
jgi:hypothetical protein